MQSAQFACKLFQILLKINLQNFMILHFTRKLFQMLLEINLHNYSTELSINTETPRYQIINLMELSINISFYTKTRDITINLMELTSVEMLSGFLITSRPPNSNNLQRK